MLLVSFNKFIAIFFKVRFYDIYVNIKYKTLNTANVLYSLKYEIFS